MGDGKCVILGCGETHVDRFRLCTEHFNQWAASGEYQRWLKIPRNNIQEGRLNVAVADFAYRTEKERQNGGAR